MHNSKSFLNGLLRVFVPVCLLMCVEAQAQTFPIDSLQYNGPRNKRINLVFVSDGYTSAELTNFVTNATTVNTALMNTVPFSNYKTFFNTYVVKVPSTNSGTKHPGTASDESSSGGQPVANPTTYFSSTFDYGGIHRLVYQSSLTPITNVLSANLPQYNQGFVLANSTYYGGAGGTYATATTHASSAEIAIHEIGHSFGALADEYWAGAGYAAEKANMTQTSSPTTVKWKNWIGINGTGVYAYGTSGAQATWYRPHQSCKMQYLGYAFCSVCTEAFVSKFHSLVNMIDSYLPTSTSFTLVGTGATSFSVTHLQTSNNTIKVKWYLNNSTTPFATGASVSIPYATFVNGTNTVKASVIDSTGLSKSYLPAVGYVKNVTWTVTKSTGMLAVADLAGEIKNNVGYISWAVPEVNGDEQFFIARSIDGINFKTVNTLQSQPGLNRYTFIDSDIQLPVSYYKVSVKRGSNIVSSDAIRLQKALSSLSYKVYQDALARRYNINYASETNLNVYITITNANGQQVLKRDLGKTSQSSTYTFDLANQPPGVYYMTLFIGNESETTKLMAL
ncbi:putative secreted protein (Por secretion system target) [Chitinophaga skermanii]|uniref:Putative secreted protein (Por secretion system target) n=1 Tax=Chitinophaga skermanii TaxID=331697 RepID=A0A327QL87_9BACT|nr:M64 family metallopeptidase [Chitinophaga skermanii]RAJ05309.1 putative secreted protein (Por secretion system target) [Chitinophaga skermanii]